MRAETVKGRALALVAPAEIESLQTPESIRVMSYYRRHSYWLSEIYDFKPEWRSDLRAVLRQLKERKTVDANTTISNSVSHDADGSPHAEVRKREDGPNPR